MTNNHSSSSTNHNYRRPIQQESADTKWLKYALDQHVDSNVSWYSPTDPAQINLLLHDPIVCFCGREAHTAYTSEFGPILECASFNYDNRDESKFQSKYICGFHVHLKSWLEVLESIKSDTRVNLKFAALKSCPQYNFTFCSFFKVDNSYNLSSPNKLPECFCHKPIVMKINEQSKIQFSCKQYMVAGAKKCSWNLPSNEVAFPKPTVRLHKLISHEQYIDEKQQKREKIQAQRRQLSLSSIQSEDTLTPRRFVPTCVLAKKQQHLTSLKTKPPSLSASSSSSTLCTANTDCDEEKSLDEPSNNNNQQTIEKLQKTNMSLQQTLKEKDTRIKQMISQFRESSKELHDEIHQKKNNTKMDAILKLQERLSNLELNMVYMMNENKLISTDIDSEKEENIKLSKFRKDEPSKCIVCQSNHIEYCIEPCFHYAYCQECVKTLKDCVICDQPIKKAQKIYQA